MKFHYKMPSPIGFQLAPMLDIVFLLLVFFIVTQTFEDDEPDLSINLPSAETPKPGENVSNEIIVNIRKDGTVVINRQHYTMPQLEDKLFSVTRLDKTMLVRIRVDEKAESGVVVHVMDACLKAGLNNVSFSTRPPVPSSINVSNSQAS